MTAASNDHRHDGAGHTTRLPPGLQQLAALLADGLGEFANATLGLDPTGTARLAELEGSRLVIRARLPGGLPVAPETLEFTLTVDEGRMRLRSGALDGPHAILSGSMTDLMAWALSRGLERPAGLRIDGDARILETLGAIARNYRPELERPLARLLGHNVATQLLDAADLAVAGIRSALQAATTGLRQGAGQWFASEPAIAGFLDELEELQLAADRLAARVGVLEADAARRPPAEGRQMP